MFNRLSLSNEENLVDFLQNKEKRKDFKSNRKMFSKHHSSNLHQLFPLGVEFEANINRFLTNVLLVNKRRFGKSFTEKCYPCNNLTESWSEAVKRFSNATWRMKRKYFSLDSSFSGEKLNYLFRGRILIKLRLGGRSTINI